MEIIRGGNRYRKSTKALDVRLNNLRDAVYDGGITLKVLNSADNMADALTKALPKEQFLHLRKRMILEPKEPKE